MTLGEAISQWFQGIPIDLVNQDLYGLKFIWVDRWASVLQFVGGLTIIAEIIGKDKISHYQSMIRGIAAPRKLFLRTKTINKHVYFIVAKLIYGYRVRRILNNYSDGSNYLLIKNTICNNATIKKWKNIKRKYRETRKYKTIILSPVISFFLSIVLLNEISKHFISFGFDDLVYNGRGYTIPFHFGINGNGFSIRCINYFLGFCSTMVYLFLYSILTVCMAFTILPFVLFVANLLTLVFVLSLELLVLYPSLLYLYLSQKEKLFKLFGFILISIGFFFDFLCS